MEIAWSAILSFIDRLHVLWYINYVAISAITAITAIIAFLLTDIWLAAGQCEGCHQRQKELLSAVADISVHSMPLNSCSPLLFLCIPLIISPCTVILFNSSILRDSSNKKRILQWRRVTQDSMRVMYRPSDCSYGEEAPGHRMRKYAKTTSREHEVLKSTWVVN